jgi:hypothetical protein
MTKKDSRAPGANIGPGKKRKSFLARSVVKDAIPVGKDKAGKADRTPGRVQTSRPATSDDAYARIRALLLDHLGSPKAVDAWLDSPDTGYPTTARDAVNAGHAEFVLKDLESQWGPNPSYA